MTVSSPAPAASGAAAPRSVDEARDRVIYVTIGGAIAAIVVLSLVLTPLLRGISDSAPVLLAVGALVVLVLLAVAWGIVWTVMSNAAGRRFAVVRGSAHSAAESVGWTWADAGPAPSPEVMEAAFRSQRGSPLSATQATQVMSGAVAGMPFTAEYIDGYRVGNGSMTRPGPDRGVNLVMLRLPGELPELRLGDLRFAPKYDYGLRLPRVDPRDAAVAARWSVETRHPDVALPLMTPAFRAALAAMPSPCSVVIRDGMLIGYGDPVADFTSIQARVTALGALAETIPAEAYGHVSPAVAGHGAYPLKFARRGLAVWGAERV